jgi:hypothetical protein
MVKGRVPLFDEAGVVGVGLGELGVLALDPGSQVLDPGGEFGGAGLGDLVAEAALDLPWHERLPCYKREAVMHGSGGKLHPVRDVKPPTTVPASFRTPFAGHLPGYRAASKATAPGRPDEHVYNELLMAQWRALLDSPESRDEWLLHAFLERHPSLLPGSATVIRVPRARRWDSA